MNRSISGLFLGRNTAFFLAIFLFLLLPFYLGAQTKGYSIAGNQIQVNSDLHWQQWEVAGGIAHIAEGAIGSKLMRKNINAALNAEVFSLVGQGGVESGSNQGDAGLVIDGDPGTSWGPDTENSPLKDWWVTINLGRLVVAQKIVVHFAEEGIGDPLLQFKVLVWRHGPSRAWNRDYNLKGTDIPNFWEIGRTSKPNKSQRALEFVPHTTELTNGIFVGDPIERVQIVALDSDFDRAFSVNQEQYEVLPDDQKGAVDHFRKGESGRESLISEEAYFNEIEADRRGAIKYYRKEIPRVAEIEVWTAGDNVNLGTVDRGGVLTVDTNAGPKDLGDTVTDGDYTTGHNGSLFGLDRCPTGECVYFFFEDLGALFWLDTMHFITDGASGIDQLSVEISDGTRAPDGTIKWSHIASSIGALGTTSHTGRAVRYREFRMEPAKVRFIRAPHQNPDRGLSYIGFTEVMLYGEGFVPEVELTSDLIELGGEKNLISIEWQTDVPQGTRVELQTRTGNTLLEEKIYLDSKGNVVTEKRYNKLPKSKKGEIKSFFRPDPDWLPWSEPYVTSGMDITSPSPREYMLIRARLLSDRRDLSASVSSITVNLSDPLADHLVGEVWPNQLEAIGRADSISFFIRPTFSSSRQGFDEIMIEATAGTIMDLLEVRLGSDADFNTDQAERFAPSHLQVLASGADTLWLRLPVPVARGVDLVEVVFRPTILANSASFRASGQDSGSPGFWQRVDEGDATDLVSSQVTTVLALGANQVIQDFRLDSEVLTPNGDGINDEMGFNFSVARISVEKSVKLTIYDLSGIAVAEVVEQRLDPRASFSLVWSGENGSGQLVPPGIYLARIEVEVDSESARVTRVDRLVYVAY